jgi:rifampicin phosphotransferase
MHSLARQFVNRFVCSGKNEIQDCVVWLSEVDLTRSPTIGQKAKSLARMLQSGLPIPEGFCIPTTAFMPASIDLQESKRWGDQSGKTGEIVPGNLSTAIRSKVMEALLILEGKYGQDIYLAVRSSAVQEDLFDASFAGQYKTVLNVHGPEALFRSIDECLQSTFSNALHAYRSYKAIKAEEYQMAILVQVMVKADFAGILFTADPRTLDPSRIVVEMMAGIGEDVASGEVNPTRFSIERKTGNIQWEDESLIRHCETDVTGLPWNELFALSMKIESLFQAAQDIEWAYQDNQFWILQSRSITTPPERSPRQIWTRANAGEILPGVVKPLTWSIFKPILATAGYYRGKSPLTIHWHWQHPTGEWPDSPRLFSGKAYMELASVFTSFANSPGVNSEILQKILGFEFDQLNQNEFPIKKPRKHIADPYRRLRFWMESLGITHILKRTATKQRTLLQKFKEQDISNSKNRHLSAAILRIDGLLEEVAKALALHIQATSFAFSTYGLIDEQLRRFTPPELVQNFETGITSEFQHISTAQQMIAIWDLANAIYCHPTAKKVLIETEPVTNIIETWKNCPTTIQIFKMWEAFIAEFGDRSTQEFELSVAHWDEDPTFVLITLRELVQSDQPDPRQRLIHKQDEGKQLIEKIETHITELYGFRVAYFFKRLYNSFKEFVPLRENLKYSVVSWFNLIRKEVLQLAEIFMVQGHLDLIDDIYFLTYQEIKLLANDHGSKNMGVQAVIAQRKKEYLAFLGKTTADLIIVREGKEIPITRTSNTDKFILKGIPCCHGIVVGPAFVLNLDNATNHIPPGQILIMPSIDPGLTPLFIGAIGLVTEIGGLLSHGATLARELGLPTIVGIPHVTEKIRSGQQITLNGYNGEVNLVSES